MSITHEQIAEHNLTADEYAKILKILGRQPSPVELGIFSVMWSEHCSYKSSKKFLKNFPTTGPLVIQGPGENAGVVDIGDNLALVFKMESHNHPSFIEPYQGAATGVGGILRDIFTMGARPIANLNSLRFGAVDHPKTSSLVDDVVAGIAGYGNCMGVPTVGGEVVFDACYNGNILVNAMTVGLVAKDKIFKGLASGPGNPVFYVGSKTGRDGIHGATMASDSFDDLSDQKKPTVQVGDPFTEKKLLEACLELMQYPGVIVGIQDMGAAGLTSSSFEMASRAGTGIEIDLDSVPLREAGMTAYEIMLSESQERMLLVCNQGKESVVYEVFQKWDLDVSRIGTVTDTGRYRALFKGKEVVSVPVDPLAEAAPVYDRPRQQPKNFAELQKLPALPSSGSALQSLQLLLKHPNAASKKWVYRQYDHMVMTNTVVMPGSDAAVLRIKGTSKGIALTTNVNSRYCYLDPHRGGMIAVAESGRNVVCAGAMPLAITDCLNFGNPESPEIMWQFEECILGISEACRFFNTPVVSGNVSFYNETNGVSIYPTPTIGMVGLMENIADHMTAFFQNVGDVIFLLGETKDELGGSEYLAVCHGLVRGRPPELDLKREQDVWGLLASLNKKQLIRSAHDLSESGLALALLESCFGQNLFAVDVDLQSDLGNDAALFSETQSRILVSAGGEKVDEISQMAEERGVPCKKLGVVTEERVRIKNNGKEIINAGAKELKKIWETGFEQAVFHHGK